MKKLLLPICLLAVVSPAFGQSNDENPGSLWPSNYINPILDRTARREGDLITILVSESSAASFAAATSSSKSDKTNVARINVPILAGLFSALGISAESSSTGSGNTTQTGKLTARISATVVKVLPNGNLVIEGLRWIRVNKESQMLKISGIVRRDDVRADNTVFSENIAEAEIRLDGQGAISDKQRRGILTRILSWLF